MKTVGMRSERNVLVPSIVSVGLKNGRQKADGGGRRDSQKQSRQVASVAAHASSRRLCPKYRLGPLLSVRQIISTCDTVRGELIV